MENCDSLISGAELLERLVTLNRQRMDLASRVADFLVAKQPIFVEQVRRQPMGICSTGYLPV